MTNEVKWLNVALVISHGVPLKKKFQRNIHTVGDGAKRSCTKIIIQMRKHMEWNFRIDQFTRGNVCAKSHEHNNNNNFNLFIWSLQMEAAAAVATTTTNLICMTRL